MKILLLLLRFAFTINMIAFAFCNNAFAQNKNQIVRLAKVVIDSLQLENYKAALKEEIETYVRVESGVKTLYAVSEKIIQHISLF